MFLESGDRLSREIRAEGDDQCVRFEAFASNFDGSSLRVDTCYRILNHTYANLGQAFERPLTFLQRRLTNECPRLAEAHHEVRTLIYKSNFNFCTQFLFQAMSGCNSAET